MSVRIRESKSEDAVTVRLVPLLAAYGMDRPDRLTILSEMAEYLSARGVPNSELGLWMTKDIPLAQFEGPGRLTDFRPSR